MDTIGTIDHFKEWSNNIAPTCTKREFAMTRVCSCMERVAL